MGSLVLSSRRLGSTHSRLVGCAILVMVGLGAEAVEPETGATSEGEPANSTPQTPAPEVPQSAEAAAVRAFQHDWHRLVGKNVSERDYPRLARDRGWQGSTMLRAEIGSDGLLKAVSVRRSTGYSILDDAAVSKVWRTELPTIPDELRGRPFSVDIPFKFSLRMRNLPKDVPSPPSPPKEDSEGAVLPGPSLTR